MIEKVGLLFNIQRASLDDGPGVRTVFFLKGCPLCCPWCHNPEGQSMRPELISRKDKCVGCGACEAVCPASAVREACVDRAKCVMCGECERACNNGAMEVAGKYYSVSEVIDRALLDRAFYDVTGGGVTLSGENPLRSMSLPWKR